MERHKTIFLVLLVFLSIFLSYKLMFEMPEKQNFELEIDEQNIIAYKRFYSVNPNREALLEIPNKEINEFLVKSLKDSTPERVGDQLISSELKDEGYLVISAFDLPINVVFSAFKEKMPKLPFESFDRMYFTKKGEVFLNTEAGVYKVKTGNKIEISESVFEKCVLLDENFMPTKIVGVNSYATVINPVEDYTIADRVQLASGFLKENVAEIIEEDGYLFSTEEEYLRIHANGIIHYLNASFNDKIKTNLYDSLVAVRSFVTKAPLNFSNYRIVNIFEEDNNTLFHLADANLPFYSSEMMPILVNISGGKVTFFSYDAKFLRDFHKIYLEPEVSMYRDAFKKAKDPILVYSEENGRRGRVVLKVMDTR